MSKKEKLEIESHQKVNRNLPNLISKGKNLKGGKKHPKSALKKSKAVNLYTPGLVSQSQILTGSSDNHTNINLKVAPKIFAQVPQEKPQLADSIMRILPMISSLVRDNVTLITSSDLFKLLCFDPNEESIYNIKVDAEPVQPKEVLVDLDENRITSNKNIHKEFLLIDLREPWEFSKMHIRECRIILM